MELFFVVRGGEGQGSGPDLEEEGVGLKELFPESYRVLMRVVCQKAKIADAGVVDVEVVLLVVTVGWVRGLYLWRGPVRRGV